MNPARVLHLAIAIGAGSIAARPVSGPDGKSLSKRPVLRFFVPGAPIRISANRAWR